MMNLIERFRSFIQSLFPTKAGVPHDAAFVGKHEIAIETCVVEASQPRLQGWRVEIDNEWLVYELNSLYDLNEEQRYDDRHWMRGPDGFPLDRNPICQITPPVGRKVIWKAAPYDYFWDDGEIIRIGDNYYVSNPRAWASIGWSVKRGCLVTTGSCTHTAGDALLLEL